MGIPASHLLKGLLNHHDMMKDLAVDWRHLPKNRMCPSSRPSQHHYTPRYSPRYRSVVTTLLILLCIPIFFYHLIPRYTSATDGIISSLAHKLHPAGTTSSFCTKEVGSLQCCALYLAAAPCQDECRKNHMDRETLALTKEYDECADQCLVEYNKSCTTKTTGDENEQTKTEPPRQRGSRTAEWWSTVQHTSE